MSPDPLVRASRPTALTLAWFSVLALGALRLRNGDLRALRALFTRPTQAAPATVAAGLLATPAAPAPPPESVAEVPIPPPADALAPFTGRPLDDPCVREEQGRCVEHAMDAFVRALRRTDARAQGAVTRVAHLGDSVVADDKITARLRRRLLTRFGDGGSGWVPIAPASRWFRNHHATLDAHGWTLRSVVGARADDGRYGPAGAVAQTDHDATSVITTATRPGLGHAVARYDLYYLQQPGGGSVELSVDGRALATLGLDAPTAREAFHPLVVDDGAHALTLRAHGPARVFGVTLEREGPGVVVDNMGLVGSSARALLASSPEHLATEIAHRHSDLTLVLLGANEASHGPMGGADVNRFQAGFEALLSAIRAARPDGSCLVMAPLDTASERDGEIASRPAIAALVTAEARAAAARGCAFWNTYAWMGGDGSMVRWYARGWSEPDYTHPTDGGAARVADALFDALMHRYAQGAP